MINIVDKDFLKISNDCFVLCTPTILNKNITSKTSIIYFEEIFSENSFIHELLNNDLIDKIIVISKHHNQTTNKKILFYSHFSKSIIKSLGKNFLVHINLNNNYEYLKFVVTNLINLFGITSDLNKFFNFSLDNYKIICSVSQNNSKYFNDIINCIKVLLLSDKQKRYEYIYDTVCDYLDSQFHDCNLCDFKNDQCVANRAKRTAHETMGCCYSFNYAGVLDFRLVKDVQLCQYMQNRTCATKNITCKLFTCRYLKENNVKFDTHKILLLDCFFNKKQHDIIQSNFFKTREQILEKLLETNHDIYFWYLFRRKYMIKLKS